MIDINLRTFLILDLLFDVFDRVRWFDIECNCLARECCNGVSFDALEMA